MGNNEIELKKYLSLLAKTSSFVVVSLFISKILGYLYRIIIARNFDPEVYGIFSLAIMVSGFFIVISSNGFTEGLVRFISSIRAKNEPDKEVYIYRYIFNLLCLTSIISGLILYFFSETISIRLFKSVELIPFLKVFSLLIPVGVISNVFLSVLQAYERVYWYSLGVNIIQNLTKILAILIMLYLGFGNSSVYGSYFVGAVLLLIFSFYSCKFLFPKIFLKYYVKDKDKKELRMKINNYSFPLIFSGILYILFYWADSFSLGYLKGPYEVGLYSVAASISLLLTLIPEIFTSLFFPLISKSYAENKVSLVEELSKQVNKWIFLIILPAVVIMFIFPGAIINILFGQEYLFASDALRILLIGIFISAISVIPQQIIKTSGESKVILYGVAICSLLNLILNFIFIPIPKIFLLDNQSGLVGAAIATSLSLSVLTIIFYMKVYSITKIIPIRRKMIIGFLAAVVPVYVMLYLRNNMQTNIINIIIISLFYLILYLLFIFVFKGFDRYDLEILSKYLKKGESFFRKKKEKDI